MSRNTGQRVANLHVRGDNAGLMGIESDAFIAVWGRGQKATQPSARLQQTANGGVVANSRMLVQSLSEDIDLGGATSVLSANYLLPDTSIILGIVTQPLIDFSTPVTYDLGVSGSNTRFGDDMTNNLVSEGAQVANRHLFIATLAMYQVTKDKVKITPNAAGTGRLRVTVFYMQFLGNQA